MPTARCDARLRGECQLSSYVNVGPEVEYCCPFKVNSILTGATNSTVGVMHWSSVSSDTDALTTRSNWTWRLPSGKMTAVNLHCCCAVQPVAGSQPPECVPVERVKVKGCGVEAEPRKGETATNDGWR